MKTCLLLLLVFSLFGCFNELGDPHTLDSSPHFRQSNPTIEDGNRALAISTLEGMGITAEELQALKSAMSKLNSKLQVALRERKITKEEARDAFAFIIKEYKSGPISQAEQVVVSNVFLKIEPDANKHEELQSAIVGFYRVSEYIYQLYEKSRQGLLSVEEEGIFATLRSVLSIEEVKRVLVFFESINTMIEEKQLIEAISDQGCYQYNLSGKMIISAEVLCTFFSIKSIADLGRKQNEGILTDIEQQTLSRYLAELDPDENEHPGLLKAYMELGHHIDLDILIQDEEQDLAGSLENNHDIDSRKAVLHSVKEFNEQNKKQTQKSKQNSGDSKGKDPLGEKAVAYLLTVQFYAELSEKYKMNQISRAERGILLEHLIDLEPDIAKHEKYMDLFIALRGYFDQFIKKEEYGRFPDPAGEVEV